MSSNHLAAGRQFRLSALLISILLGVLSGCSDSSDSDEPTTQVPDASLTPLVLEPLPNPPLTEAPSADDEPVPFDSVFHTVTDYALVRDTGPRIDDEIIADLTEADFSAGLPEAEITVPAEVDTASNGAPFFEGLSNVRVEAGQRLEIRYVPRDPEGELPGMFPLALPEGATFDDNFDGTKTLNWQTYQADIGITGFTVVAIDPDNGEYRSSQTVLIAIDPPSDPASVPNIAPSIVPIATYTVRAGDPVSIFIIGTDRNGTTPSIELVDPPANAILTPDARTPEWQILHAVPETAGTLIIDVLTRDADDPSLTGLDQITLNVVEPADFERSGERLKAAAAGSNVQFGSAISPVFYMQADGALYESIAASEFGVMSPESSMKWIAINPVPGQFEFADMDNLISFAKANDMQVRGHPLVWHRSLPDWVEQSEVEDREVHMREFITRVMNRYSDDVTYWDVINEPVADDGGMRDSLWFEAMGEQYIDIAFAQARELDPTAVLVLNEYDIGFAGPKFDGLLSLLDRLEAREVPVDAVGFQLHVFSSFDQFDELAANMAAIAERGLDIHITELDVAIVNDDSEQTQADVYSSIVDTCLAQVRCTVIQSWGFTDRYSFRTTQSPLYLNTDYVTKPAYQALQEALGGN
ncbi:endo-1,4-beta-xylanase [Granulosicoccus antarcticus]|uniref:Beta-xylanase n=1 Tax=Granulosicoccus antarcticus IMCC3135 TaxID=1192854 RepID=A0A2Z2NHM0_9GAMM|nr:endo-1,4-beta-xylanase [Granulosicoccus antarcticus]ASJ70639.1 Endo-1,4-beta-xylanase Z [Granulosicoccus antarcticus IMCC3135]